MRIQGGKTGTGAVSTGGKRLLIFADSFGANGSSSTDASQSAVTTYVNAPGPWLEAMSQGALLYSHAMNKSVSGQTSTDLLARLTTDVVANANKFDVMLLDVGRNDVTASTAAATTIANMTKILQTTVALGKQVIMMLPNPPRGSATGLNVGSITAAQRKIAVATNLAMRDLSRKMPGVFMIDTWSDWVDATLDTGVDALGNTYDGLHPSRQMAYKIAKRTWACISSLFPIPPRNPMQWDAYDAVNCPRGNLLTLYNSGAGVTMPMMRGTTGNKLSGTTGSLADNFQIGTFSGTVPIAASKLAGASGYDSYGADRQVLNFAALSAAWLGSMEAGAFGGKTPCPVELLGLYVQAEIEVEVLTTAAACGLPVLECQTGNAGAWINTSICLSALDTLTLQVDPGKYYLRTQPTLVSAVNSTPSLNLAVIFNLPAASSSSYNLGRPAIRVCDSPLL